MSDHNKELLNEIDLNLQQLESVIIKMAKENEILKLSIQKKEFLLQELEDKITS